MGLFRKVKNAEVERIHTNPTLQELEDFFGCRIGGISGSMLNSATYYACMQIRCNAIAKLPIKLMQETDSGAESRNTEDIARLLRERPNPYTTPHEFVWATEYQKLEHGNAFWLPITVKGKIKELYLLNSANMEIVIDLKRKINGKYAVFYLYQDEKNGEQIYSSDEIIHFKNFALNGIKGTSVKEYLSGVVNNEKMAQEVIKEKYSSGLQDPIVVHYIGEISEARQKESLKSFQI